VVLEGAAGNGRTPNTTRISGVPHLINLMPFGGHDWRWSNGSISGSGSVLDAYFRKSIFHDANCTLKLSWFFRLQMVSKIILEIE
jgi:hypothetical protein